MSTARVRPLLGHACIRIVVCRVRRALCGVALAAGAAHTTGCGATPAAAPEPAVEPLAPTPQTPTAGGQTTYFPPVGAGAWETTSAAAVGWDSTALAAAVAFAGERNSTALLVLHRGRLVTERYWRGWTPSTTQQIASAGKSVAAVLVGGLRERGRVSLDAPVTTVVGPGWSRADAARERAVTVGHLLGMASGLDAQLRYERPPGTRFFYNNSAYFKLFDVIQHPAGRSVADVMREQLAGPIGLEGAQWRAVVEADGTPGFRLWMTARDMARFGLLVAAGGRWGTVPVLADTTFLSAMLAPQAPDNPAFGMSGPENVGAVVGPGRR
jgi:CubicO group peptidase (beta-lactamase class C family)